MRFYKRLEKWAVARGAMAVMTLAMTIGAADVARGAEVPDAAAFDADLQALTANPNRLAGREDGSLVAARYVEKRLREMGIEEIYTQSFPIIMPRMTECELEVDGDRHRIYAMRPNLLQAAITPADGLAGRTLYLGQGHPEDYGRHSAEGRIAVLDLDCGKRWVNAFAFGARAVLFVERPDQAERAVKHLNIPANLPRFFVPSALADQLALTGEPREVRIRAAASWEALRGQNVIGVIRGTAPVFDPDRRSEAEALVLAAPLDSYSEVPELSPGARDAANCAALLRIAEQLHKNPPRRDIVVAFFDAQAQAHQGARAFYGSLFRRHGKRKIARSTIEMRLEMIADEAAHLEAVQKILDSPNVFDDAIIQEEAYIPAMRMLRNVTSELGSEALQDLSAARLRLRKLRSKEFEDDPEAPAEIKMLEPGGAETGQIDFLQVEDLAWNSVLRLINERSSDAAAAGERLALRLLTDENEALREKKQTLFKKQLRDFFDTSIQQVRVRCRTRLKELETKRADTEVSLAIREAVGQQRNFIALHVGINFGDSGSRWSFVHGDQSNATLGEDVEGLYAVVFKAIRETYETHQASVPNFDPRPVSGLFASALFAPASFADNAAIARMFRRFNLSLITVHDRMPRQGLPRDTVAALNAGVIRDQADEAALFLRRLADDGGLGRDFPHRVGVFYGEERWSGSRNVGRVAKQSDIGDPMRSASVANTVVAMVPTLSPTDIWANMEPELSPPGHERALRVQSASHGIFETPPVARELQWFCLGATFDERQLDGTTAASSRGLISGITVQKAAVVSTLEVFNVDLARVRGLTVVGYGFDRKVPTTVMRALSTSRFRDDRHLLCESENVLVLFAPRDATAAKLFNPYGVVLLNNKMTRESYQGDGYPLADAFLHPVASRQSAVDLHTLNGYRLNLLRENQIGEESLEVLHGRASDIAEDAESLKSDSLVRYHGMMEAAASFSRRMYKPLVGVMNDLVTAVVFLLVLAIPFAYAMERLLIGTPHIYQRIGWFAGFFILTFVLLYLVNPAFKLAATPVIIFLAFTIILLSTLVIFIMLRKLETEMKKFQGLTVSAHSVDVSRVSTLTAAVNIGISTMRRRPLRTLLTSVTVVLLTFTILTFASFSSEWGNRRTYSGPMVDPPARILVRHALWEPVSEGLPAVLTGVIDDRAVTVPRYWLSPLAKEAAAASKSGTPLEMLLAGSVGGDVVRLSAALGLDSRDVEQQQRLRECFTDASQLELLKDNGIFLTRAVSEAMGLADADIGKTTLRLKGREFLYAGETREQFAVQTMLDGSSILPVDYLTSAGGKEEAAQTQTTELSADSESASFISFSADAVAVIGAAAARDMGARLRALSVYSKTDENLDLVAEDVASISALPTYVGGQSGVYRLFFSKIIEASGFRDLLIPVVLGGLIIFATMLGSVADREREIYAFSSLGLAPTHVATLFFAESSVYAVVGGMGGYLLGQATAKLLALLSAYASIPIPSMNFSSMNAVATIFIVMGVVLLSTLYPAMKAARSASPGIQRTWQLPNPVGDIYDINFPFTVSEYDLTGVVSYLQEHFEGFADASVGTFATQSCRILRQKENDMLGFAGHVALAPFDLGIEETFVILSQPSDVEGIDEVRVLIKRLSGSYGDWRRATRVFINSLRKQFLIWRTIDEQIADRYRETTLDQWQEISVESRDQILSEYTPQDEGATDAT